MWFAYTFKNKKIKDEVGVFVLNSNVVSGSLKKHYQVIGLG